MQESDLCLAPHVHLVFGMDVVIIGGGLAGLSAAAKLQHAGLRTIVLEARGRLGGRALSKPIAGVPIPVELGAELVHGDLIDTLANAPLTPVRVTDLLRKPSGLVVECDEPVHRFREGHSALVAYLREQAGDIQLHAEVTRVQWDSRGARLTLRGGETIFCRAVICALPLGVLRYGGPHFNPPLDEKLRQSGALIVSGAQRVTLELTQPVFPWDGFMQIARPRFSLYWSQTDCTIVAFAPGESASALNAAERIDDAFDGLCHAVGETLPRSLLAAAHLHDFAADPYSLGSYVFADPSQTHAALALARPLRSVLFFAGDATHAGALGTVQGAVASGERAAAEVKLSLTQNGRTSRRAPYRGSASLLRE